MARRLPRTSQPEVSGVPIFTVMRSDGSSVDVFGAQKGLGFAGVFHSVALRSDVVGGGATSCLVSVAAGTNACFSSIASLGLGCCFEWLA